MSIIYKYIFVNSKERNDFKHDNSDAGKAVQIGYLSGSTKMYSISKLIKVEYLEVRSPNIGHFRIRYARYSVKLHIFMLSSNFISESLITESDRFKSWMDFRIISDYKKR